MTTTIRPATEADLSAVSDIYYRSEVEGHPNPPAPHPFSGLDHVLATGQMYVAESDGAVIGYASRIVRGRVAFLTDLFVTAERQSSHAGRALLQATMPAGENLVHCTLSSTDPRAQSLYIRAGMRPQWPNFVLRASAATLGPLPDSGVRLSEAAPDDPALVEWDATIAGRRRPEDFLFWLGPARAVPFWIERGGDRVGYVFVQRRAGSSVWYPDAFTVGPIGALTAEDAAAGVFAATAWAGSRAEVIRASIPGPHPALAPLLDAGFKIVYVDTFCAGGEEPIFDARQYASSGDLL